MKMTIYKEAIELLETSESIAIHTIYPNVKNCKILENTANRLSPLEKTMAACGTPEYDALLTRLSSDNFSFQGGIIRSLDKNKPLETVELYNKKPRFIILGGGHIALPLVKIGKLLGFKVAVCDDRPAFANTERFKEADIILMDEFSNSINKLDIQKNDFIAVVTRGHKHDADCLRAILNKAMPRYLGMIGSKRRVGIVMADLKKEGYSEENINAIHSPIGLSIGAITPEEISVSIMAEIIQARRVDAKHSAYVSGMDDDILRFLANAKEGTALLTIISSSGSVPREAGAKMVIDYMGNGYGSIGGGCSESAVLDIARRIIRTGGWQKEKIDLHDHAENDGMVCGGELTVLIEAID
jgi:xanthine dehydrogenase accessory factor